MLSIDLRIDRAERLLRMIEEDAPLLNLRVAPLSSEHQRAARLHAERLAEITRAEIERLLEEKAAVDIVALSPQAAD
jgi:phosphoribosylaminoimidazole carboxylase (NCAIR synthetase)